MLLTSVLQVDTGVGQFDVEVELEVEVEVIETSAAEPATREYPGSQAELVVRCIHDHDVFVAGVLIARRGDRFDPTASQQRYIEEEVRERGY